MDNRPIGVFDSGLGGLTAVKALKKLLPHEDIVYFGDTGRVPYGSRSKETLMRFTRQNLAFLRTHDVKCVIVACGTVSSVVLPSLREELPVVGVIEPSVKKAAALSQNRKIGALATTAAIRGGSYQAALRRAAPDAEVTATDAPLLVPIVENGRTALGDIVAETLVAEYLAPHRAAGVDTLLLGCTHYPLLRDIVQQVMGDGVNLVDVGAEAAGEMAELLAARGIGAAPERTGNAAFYVSDDADGFAQNASLFLGERVDGCVFLVDSGAFL